MSEIARLRWYRNRTWEKMRKFKDTKPELATKQILDLLNVKYERNFSVGSGFTVDFYIPKYNILLDIDGEYWYGRFNHEHKQVDYVVSKDDRKNKYINSLSQYKYYRLWELTTFSKEALLTIISRLLDKNVPVVDFNLKSLIFKEVSFEDSKMFIEKFHYSGHIGPAIKTFGALYNNEIIGIGVFKYPTYNTNIGRVELSRFCIHPAYQKKNAASFILSRFVNMVDAKEIITYADTTQCHNGTIYKASNFKKDSITENSYYYVDEYNSKYHKKVIYNHARCMKMSENDYVEKTGLRKVIEKPKIKFIFHKNKIELIGGIK
jgi:G:T-mismatch repair DNA endonuclease (very short patch repair protein)